MLGQRTAHSSLEAQPKSVAPPAMSPLRTGIISLQAPRHAPPNAAVPPPSPPQVAAATSGSRPMVEDDGARVAPLTTTSIANADLALLGQLEREASTARPTIAIRDELYPHAEGSIGWYTQLQVPIDDLTSTRTPSSVEAEANPSWLRTTSGDAPRRPRPNSDSNPHMATPGRGRPASEDGNGSALSHQPSFSSLVGHTASRFQSAAQWPPPSAVTSVHHAAPPLAPPSSPPQPPPHPGAPPRLPGPILALSPHRFPPVVANSPVAIGERNGTEQVEAGAVLLMRSPRAGVNYTVPSTQPVFDSPAQANLVLWLVLVNAALCWCASCHFAREVKRRGLSLHFARRTHPLVEGARDAGKVACKARGMPTTGVRRECESITLRDAPRWCNTSPQEPWASYPLDAQKSGSMACANTTRLGARHPPTAAPLITKRSCAPSGMSSNHFLPPRPRPDLEASTPSVSPQSRALYVGKPCTCCGSPDTFGACGDLQAEEAHCSVAASLPGPGNSNTAALCYEERERPPQGWAGTRDVVSGPMWTGDCAEEEMTQLVSPTALAWSVERLPPQTFEPTRASPSPNQSELSPQQGAMGHASTTIRVPARVKHSLSIDDDIMQSRAKGEQMVTYADISPRR